jgi:hypothetical protein
VTEALDRVGTAYRDGGWPAPCRASWAAAKPQAELVVLRGHDGYVNAVCTMPAGGRTLLASAGGLLCLVGVALSRRRSGPPPPGRAVV